MKRITNFLVISIITMMMTLPAVANGEDKNPMTRELEEAVTNMVTCMYQNSMFNNVAARCEGQQKRLTLAQDAFNKADTQEKTSKSANAKVASNLALEVLKAANKEYINCITKDRNVLDKAGGGILDFFDWAKDKIKIECSLKTGCSIKIGAFSEPTCDPDEPLCDPVFQPDESIDAE